VVRAGPKIIGSMLAHVSDPVSERVLQTFFQAELGHDELLMESLRSVGVDADSLPDLMPLPETFILTSSFQVWADQEPLTFRALAFLLEETNEEFHTKFASASRLKGLPEEFIQPILRHGGINDEGDHGAISETLLSTIDAVSVEERVNVCKHLTFVVDSLAALERAILLNPWTME
jgi:hypothetical protein